MFTRALLIASLALVPAFASATAVKVTRPIDHTQEPSRTPSDNEMSPEQRKRNEEKVGTKPDTTPNGRADGEATPTTQYQGGPWKGVDGKNDASPTNTP